MNDGAYDGGLLHEMVDGLIRYRDHHVPTGGFLQAVLENDLINAMRRASENSRTLLLQLVGWCYNELPSQAWGSKEKVAGWLGARQRKED